MLVYVDDLLIMSQSLHALQELKEALKAAFPMKDLGEVNSYLVSRRVVVLWIIVDRVGPKVK